MRGRSTAWSTVAGVTLSLVASSLVTEGCGRGSGSGDRASEKAGQQDKGGWEEVRIGTDAVFSGLHFVDPSVGWIVGGSPFVEGGVVGRTEDGGRTWRIRTGVAPGSRRPSYSVNAVHGFDRVRACAAGDDGILLTFDGGESWRQAQDPGWSRTHLFGLFFLDDREGWAAGLNGVIHTDDGGLTWTKRGGDSSRGGRVGGRAVHFVDPRNGWLAGQHAYLWRTRDGGETWARVPVPQPEKTPEHPPYFFGMTWVDASHGWVVGEFGTILHTTDGGDSWSLQSVGTREAFLTSVQFVDERTGWIAGHLRDKARSFVWRTADAGASWTEERRLEGEELRALQMLDVETGWAVGDRVRTQPQRMLRRARRPER
jgi:photosystem II stability/assembly factor-like uncharacterized protein